MKIVLSKLEVEKMLADKAHNILFIDVQKAGDTIPGAIALDMKIDLSGEDTFLPNPEKLADKLSELGISNTDTLVIYDEGSNRGASKAWFVFHYLGHDAVYILQDGKNDLVKTLEAVAQREPKNYIVNLRESAIADIHQVKMKMSKQAAVLVDSRANNRYRGEDKPTDLRAGHIPGAQNYHVKAAFMESGEFKSQATLAKHFSDLEKEHEVIVSCGSGNSACMNLVAMKEAGLPNVTLYSGGFSEWVADDSNEVEKD